MASKRSASAGEFWHKGRIKAYIIVLLSGVVFGGAISYLLNKIGF